MGAIIFLITLILIPVSLFALVYIFIHADLEVPASRHFAVNIAKVNLMWFFGLFIAQGVL